MIPTSEQVIRHGGRIYSKGDQVVVILADGSGVVVGEIFLVESCGFALDYAMPGKEKQVRYIRFGQVKAIEFIDDSILTFAASVLQTELSKGGDWYKVLVSSINACLRNNTEGNGKRECNMGKVIADRIIGIEVGDTDV